MGVCVSITVVPLSRPRCRVAFDRHAEPRHSAYFASHSPSSGTTMRQLARPSARNVDPRAVASQAVCKATNRPRWGTQYSKRARQ